MQGFRRNEEGLAPRIFGAWQVETTPTAEGCSVDGFHVCCLQCMDRGSRVGLELAPCTLDFFLGGGTIVITMAGNVCAQRA